MNTKVIRKLVLLGLLAGLLGAIGGYVYFLSQPLIQIFHLPETYSRRTDNFSANITGSFAPLSRRLPFLVSSSRYRINDSDWRDFPHNSPVFRMPAPLLTIEIPQADLHEGNNNITIEATSPLRSSHTIIRSFNYDPSPIKLPLAVSWEKADLEAQDGYWETVQIDDQWRVRLKPGFEQYDRMLVVTGAIPGGRRITTDAILRKSIGDQFGFGVLSMWGGHPDNWTRLPRRGWDFALSWYWGRTESYGNEISYKFAEQPPQWINSYSNYTPEIGVKNHLVMEVIEQRNADGSHNSYLHRCKWWPEGGKEPKNWTETVVHDGFALLGKEFAVCLLCFWCQVDFGPVHIEALDPVVLDR